MNQFQTDVTAAHNKLLTADDLDHHQLNMQTKMMFETMLLIMVSLPEEARRSVANTLRNSISTVSVGGYTEFRESMSKYIYI
jgi:hypothetical protein